jgi:hypothetical protein
MLVEKVADKWSCNSSIFNLDVNKTTVKIEVILFSKIHMRDFATTTKNLV